MRAGYETGRVGVSLLYLLETVDSRGPRSDVCHAFHGAVQVTARESDASAWSTDYFAFLQCAGRRSAAFRV